MSTPGAFLWLTPTTMLPFHSLSHSSQFPLLRWCDIAREFEAADRHILNLDPLSQVLFFAIAAMAARVSNHELLVGPGAPSLTSVGQDTEYRRTRELSRFGMRRHALSNRLLALAVRKLNENSAFVTPSLRSVAALCLVQTLTLGECRGLSSDRLGEGSLAYIGPPFSSVQAPDGMVAGSDERGSSILCYSSFTLEGYGRRSGSCLHTCFRVSCAVYYHQSLGPEDR